MQLVAVVARVVTALVACGLRLMAFRACIGLPEALYCGFCTGRANSVQERMIRPSDTVTERAVLC